MEKDNFANILIPNQMWPAGVGEVNKSKRGANTCVCLNSSANCVLHPGTVLGIVLRFNTSREAVLDDANLQLRVLRFLSFICNAPKFRPIILI